MEGLLNEIKEDLGYIKTEMEELKKLRRAVENLDQIPKRIEALEEEVTSLKAVAKANEERSLRNRELILENEQYGRRDNLIISGVPVAKDENLRELVKALAATLGLTLNEWDIKVVHRLPNCNGIPKIVAKMHCRELKTTIIQLSKKNKLNSAFLNMQTHECFPIYCEDHLIPEYQQVFAAARQLRKDGKLRFVGVRDCAVVVSVDEGQRLIKVTSTEQLDDLIQNRTEVPSEDRMDVENLPSQRDLQSGGQKRDLETMSPETANNPVVNETKKKPKDKRALYLQNKFYGNGSPSATKQSNGPESPSNQRNMFHYVTQGTNSSPRFFSQNRSSQGGSSQKNSLAQPYSHPYTQPNPQSSSAVN